MNAIARLERNCPVAIELQFIFPGPFTGKTGHGKARHRLDEMTRRRCRPPYPFDLQPRSHLHLPDRSLHKIPETTLKAHFGGGSSLRLQPLFELPDPNLVSYEVHLIHPQHPRPPASPASRLRQLESRPKWIIFSAKWITFLARYPRATDRRRVEQVRFNQRQIGLRCRADPEFKGFTQIRILALDPTNQRNWSPSSIRAADVSRLNRGRSS
jgi:hypothetical protein